MPTVYLGIGSNLDRHNAIQSGLAMLADRFELLAISTIYENPACGFVGNPFYNLVVALKSELPLVEFATQLRAIEFAQGRPVAAQKLAPRRFDADILLYGDLVCEEPLKLPREEILTRAFVLRPLSEIAPDLLHPQLGRRFAELWRSFPAADETLTPIPRWW